MAATLATQPPTGENPYGHNPKTWRKFLRNHEEQSANPVPDPEEYWDRHEDVINDWSGPPAKCEAQLLKEAIEENLKGWPWRGVPRKLLMVAPYAYNFYAEMPKQPVPDPLFKLPRVTQKSKLFTELFRAGPILDRIAVLLFQHHDSSWKFWATCQEAGLAMAQVLGYWDMSNGFFNHCEEPVTKTHQNPESRVAMITIVTPIRRPEGTASYVEQIENMHSLCLSVYNFAENIKNIQFHRVPFLSTRLLALLIPKMRKLENLGIYKCQLIHVGDTMRLLEIICTDRMLGKEDQVNLDFFPNYHVGPPEELGKYSVGTYGACWDNWGGDTILAIWAMVCRIIPQARKQGIDFESPHTAFRQWLEKSPCWRVEEVLKTFSDPTCDVAKFAALVDCRNPDHYGDVHKFTSKIKHRPQGWKWATQRIPCDTCRTMVLGIFFWYLNVKPIVDEDGNIIPNRVLRCLGCKFSIVLSKEKDHYKQRKRNIIRTWLRDIDGEWNDADLLGAIKDIVDRGVINRAQQLDDARQQSIDDLGEDPELEAVQVPISDAERWQKFSSHKRSPTVEEKKGDPKFMSAEEKKWALIARPERRNEHGY